MAEKRMNKYKQGKMHRYPGYFGSLILNFLYGQSAVSITSIIPAGSYIVKNCIANIKKDSQIGICCQ